MFILIPNTLTNAFENCDAKIVKIIHDATLFQIGTIDPSPSQSWNMDHTFYNVPDPIPDLDDLFVATTVCSAGSTTTEQYRTLQLLVGTQVSNYVKAGSCLQRGHLAARQHFVFRSWQKSTYHLLNTAPTWSSFDGGYN